MKFLTGIVLIGVSSTTHAFMTPSSSRLKQKTNNQQHEALYSYSPFKANWKNPATAGKVYTTASTTTITPPPTAPSTSTSSSAAPEVYTAAVVASNSSIVKPTEGKLNVVVQKVKTKSQQVIEKSQQAIEKTKEKSQQVVARTIEKTKATSQNVMTRTIEKSQKVMEKSQQVLERTKEERKRDIFMSVVRDSLNRGSDEEEEPAVAAAASPGDKMLVRSNSTNMLMVEQKAPVKLKQQQQEKKEQPATPELAKEDTIKEEKKKEVVAAATKVLEKEEIVALKDTADSSASSTTVVANKEEEEKATPANTGPKEITSPFVATWKDPVNTEMIRPITQNWWPVAMESSLDRKKPNALEILSTKVVLWKKSAYEWTCLQDSSTDGTPLSDGTIMENTRTGARILRTYHGWDFESTGTCIHNPHVVAKADTSSSSSTVASYPVRVQGGMVWVYMDSDTPEIASTLALPVSPLLKKWTSHYDDKDCFVQDLPCGYELLAENLLDVSLFPSRYPVPGPLMPKTKKGFSCSMVPGWETASSPGAAADDEPLYQAQVSNQVASNTLFGGIRESSDLPKLTVGFYQGSHIRYTNNIGRSDSSQIELFLCPVAPGKSRVFVFNVRKRMLKSGRIQSWKNPAQFLLGAVEKVTAKSTGSELAFQVWNHRFFETMASALRKQGVRRQEMASHSNDKLTSDSASSSTLMMDAFRRYLNVSCPDNNKVSAASKAARGIGGYTSSQEEEQSSSALQSVSRNKLCNRVISRLALYRKACLACNTALTGATGGSFLMLALFFTSTTRNVILRWSMSTVGVALGAVWMHAMGQRMEDKIQHYQQILQ